MIYLIGVDHVRAQRRKRGADLADCQRKFRSVVESAIQSIDFGLLAEEDHLDFLSGPDVPSDKVSDSILLEIAKDHGIEDRHRFVDPNEAERQEIGYKQLNGSPPDAVMNSSHEIMHQFPKREEFWFKNLQGSLERNILFVCGWGHIESFSTLLAREYVSFSVLADKLGACSTQLEFYAEVRRYIEDHPAIFDKPDCFCLR